MHDAVLCMTGTVNVHTGQTLRTDPRLRLADYKAALRYYLDHNDLPVVFIENSDYDFSGDADFDAFAADARFKLIRMSPHPDRSRGKGFQEFYMLDRFAASTDARLMVKVTGRYVVKNIARMIAEMRAPLHIDLHRKLGVALTGFFAVETVIYNRFFAGKYLEADDPAGRYIEHVIYAAVTGTPLRKMTALLPENPQFRGVSGSYGAGLERNRYKMMLRGAERAVSRRLGISEFLIEY